MSTKDLTVASTCFGVNNYAWTLNGICNQPAINVDESNIIIKIQEKSDMPRKILYLFVWTSEIIFAIKKITTMPYKQFLVSQFLK